MKLLVGLGNPGREYEHHRHNIGFMAMDAIYERHNLPNWRDKFSAKMTKGQIAGQHVILLKPQTFMNLSGQAIGEASRFHKITPDNVFVFHDELDLEPGKLRHKLGGGIAGHNGLRSTREHIGENFHRIRMGIGHPGAKHLVNHWVLGDFYKSDHDEWLDDQLAKLPDAIPALLIKGGPRFISDMGQTKADSHKNKKSPSAQDIKDQKSEKPLKASVEDVKAPQNEKDSPFAALKGLLSKSKDQK